MAVSNFDDFCASLCELVGVKPPLFEDDGAPVRRFALTLGDVFVEFTEGLTHDEPGLVMSLKFGAPPSDKKLEVLDALMAANFELATEGAGAPSFAIDADSGEVWLNQWLTLTRVDAQDVYARMLEASSAVAEWRETYFLDEPVRTAPAESQLLPMSCA
jgi:hypothetical protein